jgi:hypothetical protein
MAKQIKIIDGPVDWAPEWQDNRDDPDPVTMTIRPLTRDEDNRLKRIAQKSGRSTSAVGRVFDEIRDTAILIAVSNVRNLTALAGGSVVEVKTAEDLVKYGEKDLLVEIYTAINSGSKLDEGLVKNLSSPPGLC